MNIFPAVDLYGGKAVRLTRGDYDKMTVYSDDPPAMAKRFADAGAEYIHIVDLEGARYGNTASIDVIKRILAASSLKAEVGGGIRSEDVVRKYLDAGVMRVILGTAAITHPDFLRSMVKTYGDRIAVGVDIRDGMAAIRGWTELSEWRGIDFCREMAEVGVKTIICTDISKDGMLAGASLDLYRTLSHEVDVDIVASGGVSTLEDIAALRDMDLYGAILGKALYTGALSLTDALHTAKGETA